MERRSFPKVTYLCRALTHSGKYEAAIAECHKALRGLPKWAEAHVNMAEALEAKLDHSGFCWKSWIRRDIRKEFVLAEVDALAALNMRMDAEVYFTSGRAYYGMGQDNEAIEQLRHVLEWKKTYPRAHYYLGLALRRLGRNDDATAEFAEAQRLDDHLVPPTD